MKATLRIGCLGAARIAPVALVRPAKALPEVELRAVAARDPKRAHRFAAKHGIPEVHDTYDALMDDPGLDAVYIPLPNGLHASWTLRAIEAGKHVLCEKPFTSNAYEAKLVARAADAKPDLVVMEAFHWRYHPLAARMLEIIRSGEIGSVRRIETAMCFPLPQPGDIRWQLDLAGGALMDAGCYAVHMLRTLAGEEPEVVSARSRQRSPGVDRYMQADVRFGDATGRITTSMLSSTILKISARVEGDKGRIHAFNPVAPMFPHLLIVKTAAGTKRQRIRGPSTYQCQLGAFAASVIHGERDKVLTPPADSVANMEVIDAIYRAAGMQPRPGLEAA